MSFGKRARRLTLTKVSGKLAESVVQWLGWADEDYLSARALLLGGYVVQGPALASQVVVPKWSNSSRHIDLLKEKHDAKIVANGRSRPH